MKVKVPNEVTIGAFNYKIRYIPQLVYDYKLLGQSIADKQLIKVEPDTTDQTKAVTLWHEIIHGISEIYKCDLDESNIERLAQAFGAILKNDFDIELDWSDINDENTSKSRGVNKDSDNMLVET